MEISASFPRGVDASDHCHQNARLYVHRDKMHLCLGVFADDDVDGPLNAADDDFDDVGKKYSIIY